RAHSQYGEPAFFVGLHQPRTPVVSGLLSLRVGSIGFTSTQGVLMPLNIRSEAVNQLAEKLAARTHMNKTEAVRTALANKLPRPDEAVPLRGASARCNTAF